MQQTECNTRLPYHSCTRLPCNKRINPPTAQQCVSLQLTRSRDARTPGGCRAWAIEVQKAQERSHLLLNDVDIDGEVSLSLLGGSLKTEGGPRAPVARNGSKKAAEHCVGATLGLLRTPARHTHARAGASRRTRSPRRP